jgi:peptidyl-prolyl cis-trans isomerase A (cyclophilin A)
MQGRWFFAGALAACLLSPAVCLAQAAKPTVVPVARPFVPPPAKPKPSPFVEVPAEPGLITLAQATQGLAGSGKLFASIEVEQNNHPLGTLRCELFADKAPVTVANFVGLSRGVRSFHEPRLNKWLRRPLLDGNQFHRVIPEFMIQGGDTNCVVDVTCGGYHGAGDPGYTLPDEVQQDLRFDRGGRLAMALRGKPNTAGSQFFITERETPWLNGAHTIFGQCEPLEIIRTIATVPTRQLSVPEQPVVIKHVGIAYGAPPKTK